MSENEPVPPTTAQRREAAMQELRAQREHHQKRQDVSKGRRGLVIVNTGNGKGKSTAALGLMLRANGRGLRTKLFQFLKHENAKFGEHRSLDVLDARDPDLHVVITGRGALPELIEYAQTVTEMLPIKHAFDQGIGAQAGIEH